MFMTVLGALNEGFLQTLKLFTITLLGALPLGLVISFGSMSRIPPLRWLTKTIVWMIRGTPLVLQIIALYYVPGLKGFHIWSGGESGRFTAVVVAFVINYACYFSEIYRGGIQSIPVGQEEAGLVLGMTKSQIFFQALCQLRLFRALIQIRPGDGHAAVFHPGKALGQALIVPGPLWLRELCGVLGPLGAPGFCGLCGGLLLGA